MRFFTVFVVAVGALSSTAFASPTPQNSVAGQACTDGTFDGTCRSDQRCALEIPPNEVSARNIPGQCGLPENQRTGSILDSIVINDGSDDGDVASFEGQDCTDGTFDGTCRDDGRCSLEIPPNEVSSQFVRGQCGIGQGRTLGEIRSGNNGGNNNNNNNGNGNGSNNGNNNNDGDVAGQSCTDGTFDGTCRDDGRCGLEIPPNEVSFRFVSGQCGA